VKNFPVPLNISVENADSSTVALTFTDLDPQAPLPRVDVKSGTVVHTIARHGLERPDAVALTDAAHTLTYSQLSTQINRVAAELHGYGVKRGDRVGLALEPNAVSVTIILALHALGAAYVALDDTQPVSRLVGMVTDAAVEWMISATGVVPHLDGLPIKHLRLTGFCLESHDYDNHNKRHFSSGETAHQENLRCPSKPEGTDDPAYVIFTSGSTGRPKGVEITQGNLQALLHAWDQVMGSASSRTSLLLSALTFDASVAELFWPLHSGGTLIIASPADAQPGSAGIGSLIHKHRIDHLQCTPTRATLLLAEPSDRIALAHIKHLVIGGEALTRSLANRLFDAGIERITNAYGPTEATVWAFTHEVTADLPSEVVGIGFPLDGVSWAVVSPAGEDIAEVGVLGELVLGGPFVSTGYVNQPELTAKCFFQRAYDHKPLSALHSYRTGDLVARTADGSLAFHGRQDEQVKIRGHRIELGEIEAALMAHPRVQQGVACAHWQRDSNELVAFVVLSPQDHRNERGQRGVSPELGPSENQPLVDELRAHLTQLLPAAFVPSLIALVESLPMTTSNKIDRVRVRAELLEPLFTQTPSSSVSPQQTLSAAPESHNGNVPALPATVSTEGLASMIDDFRAVLDATNQHGPHVDQDTDFFAAGGHSMFAVALLARIQDRTGVCLPIRTLLGAPTPEELCLVVQKELTGPAAFDPLVRFRLSTSPRRVYLVHGAGGNVLRYRNLASALQDVAEIVGIQAIGVEPGNPPDHTLEAMVNRYTTALLATNEDSYELGGYSDGGVVALHIAHRLRAAGKKVRSLILLDAFIPVKTPNKLHQQLANIAFSFATKETLSIRQWIRGSVVGWKKRGLWDVDGIEALAHMGYVDIYAINEAAVQSEKLPDVFYAPVLVVRTFEETPTKRRNYAVGYNASQATVAWVHGPHDELLKPKSIAELEVALRDFFRGV
jgi:amino acid adenylation domain-containing protein